MKLVQELPSMTTNNRRKSDTEMHKILDEVKKHREILDTIQLETKKNTNNISKITLDTAKAFNKVDERIYALSKSFEMHLDQEENINKDALAERKKINARLENIEEQGAPVVELLHDINSSLKVVNYIGKGVKWLGSIALGTYALVETITHFFVGKH